MADADNDAYVRLFYDRNGVLEADSEDFNLSDFGGVLPAVGDFIPLSGVLQGQDRSKAEHRTVCEVVGRYFLAGDGSVPCQVGLVVRHRRGEWREINLLGD